MNFAWTAYYALCDPPSADTIQSDDPFDLAIPFESGVFRLPICEDISMDVFFVGGTLQSFLNLLYRTYNETIDFETICSYMQHLRPVEQERMRGLLQDIDEGSVLTRLDMLGQPDPHFLGVYKGEVMLGFLD